MRLTNINCPQCNGQLNQQEDKFYCTSCGSAFNVDYDESDIEYAKLIKEPEIARLHLENNRILLQKNAELQRKFLIGEIKDTYKQELKTVGVTYASAAIYYVLIGIIVFIAVAGVIGTIFFVTIRKHKAETAKREQARIESIENLSAEDIESDRNFLENAIAGGVAYQVSQRTEPVKGDDDEGDAYLVGKPEAVNSRLLKREEGNSFIIVYKITYEFSESKTLKVVYDAVIFENIALDETGHISCKDPCERFWGREADDRWNGYENAEDVYDDVKAFPDDSGFIKVNI